MSTSGDEVKQLIKAGQKYVLVEENSEGMNAHAFIAMHLPLNRKVFLKVFYADAASSQLFQEPRFLVEATTGGAGCQNLIEVYDAEMLGTSYVLIAMECAQFGSLLSRLKTGPLRLMEAINSAIGLLHGVAQLHSCGLVHRDIKPANILLAEQASRLIPKLGDFGSVARITGPGGTVGASRHSALYVPPEGWEEPSVSGTRSDLYQVGMVLHEMVNGALPTEAMAYLDRGTKNDLMTAGVSEIGELQAFEAGKIVEKAIARRASKRRLLEVGSVQAYVPEALRRIIRKATSPTPEARYQSASEFISALNGLEFPDWEPIGIDLIRASGWKGWDWEISLVKKGPRALVRRARIGTQNWRRWREAGTIQESADLVLREG